MPGGDGYKPTDSVNLTAAMITATATDCTVAGAAHTNLPMTVTGSFSTTGTDAGQVVITG